MHIPRLWSRDFDSVCLIERAQGHVFKTKNFPGRLNLWCFHTIIYNAYTKKNEELLYVQMWANLQVILSGNSKTVSFATNAVKMKDEHTYLLIYALNITGRLHKKLRIFVLPLQRRTGWLVDRSGREIFPQHNLLYLLKLSQVKILCLEKTEKYYFCNTNDKIWLINNSLSR